MTNTNQPIVVEMLTLLHQQFGHPARGSESELSDAVIKAVSKAAELKARREYHAHLDASLRAGISDTTQPGCH